MAAPERWDEACFAVPAVRALVASGLGTGILCPAEQRDFWATLEGVMVLDFPARAKAKVVAGEISGNWQASLAWENGFAAEVFKIAGIPRRLGVNERKLKKLLTHPLGFSTGPLEHRVRHYLAAVEELGVATGRAEYFAPAALGIEPAAGDDARCYLFHHLVGVPAGPLGDGQAVTQRGQGHLLLVGDLAVEARHPRGDGVHEQAVGLGHLGTAYCAQTSQAHSVMFAQSLARQK